MKRNCRMLAAFILAAAMITASDISVHAEIEEGSGTGIGKVEGIVETDVYQVVLPTVSNHTFNFIIDPLELINQTEGAGYNGKTFEKGSTLFFHRTGKGKKEDYSSVSNPITITNRGSVPIDVSLNVRIPSSSLDGIKMTSDGGFKNDTSASLYMAVLDGENVIPIGTDGMSINKTLDAVPEEAFEYGYNKEKGKYTYELKKDLDESIFSTRSFQITGAANSNGDWSEFAEVSPQIKISWKIVQKKDEG